MNLESENRIVQRSSWKKNKTKHVHHERSLVRIGININNRLSITFEKGQEDGKNLYNLCSPCV